MALSLQDQLAKKIKELFAEAEVKKINKDNFLDIHIPFVNSKRGTHLYFNTSKDLIKIGFYCREEDFIKEILQRAKSLERYSQGIRPLGNPEFKSVEQAISSANTMLNNMVTAPITASTDEKKGAKPTKEQTSKTKSDKSLPTQKEEAKTEQNSQTKSSTNKPNKKESNEYCFDDPKSFLTSIQLLRNYYLALSKSSQSFRREFEELLYEFTKLSVVPKIGDNILRNVHEDGFGIGALLLKPMYDAEKIYDEKFETHSDYINSLEQFIIDASEIADQSLILDTLGFLSTLGSILREDESPCSSLSTQDRYLPVLLLLKNNPNLELKNLKSVLKKIDIKDANNLILEASESFNKLHSTEKIT